MRQALHQFLSIATAFLVLLSTVSLTVDMHFCGDHLVDFAIFKDADTCQMNMSKSMEDHSMMAMEMDCCTNFEVVLEGQDDLKISFDQFSLDQQVFVIAFADSFLNLVKGVDENNIPFKEYSPPPLIRNVQVLDQTFLI